MQILPAPDIGVKCDDCINMSRFHSGRYPRRESWGGGGGGALQSCCATTSAEAADCFIYGDFRSSLELLTTDWEEVSASPRFIYGRD